MALHDRRPPPTVCIKWVPHWKWRMIFVFQWIPFFWISPTSPCLTTYTHTHSATMFCDYFKYLLLKASPHLCFTLHHYVQLPEGQVWTGCHKSHLLHIKQSPWNMCCETWLSTMLPTPKLKAYYDARPLDPGQIVRANQLSQLFLQAWL